MMKQKIFILFFSLTSLAFSQTNPYNAQKKKYPLGDQFQKIMPEKIGKWNRFAFHDFVPSQETGTVYYQLDEKQIYVTFGKSLNQTNLNIVWAKIYDDATDGKAKEIKQINSSSINSKYLSLQGKSGFFYAWTRNLYFFSIETKFKSDADNFMSLFPY